jgi:hypothetical protein
MRARLLLLLLSGLAAFGWQCRSAREAAAPSDFSLYLQRTGCKGRCPTDLLTIGPGGEARYEGQRFALREGEARHTLSPRQMKQLASLFRASEFWGYAPAYNDPRIMDLPSITLECRMGGQSHKVFARFGAPASFQPLVDSILRIADIPAWPQP